MYFDFEKLDVDQVALDFALSADDVAQKLPRGRSYLKDQLLRSANSIAANIAEGVGEYSPAEKARFYRIARRCPPGQRTRPAASHRCDVANAREISLREEPACPVTITITGSGSGLSGPLCSKVSAYGVPFLHLLRHPDLQTDEESGYRDGAIVQTAQGHAFREIFPNRSEIITIGLPGSIDWYDEIVVEVLD